MQVLAFASQKGGSGKTTLSGHIAVEAELAGDGPVVMVDTDPQGSLANWWSERASPTPAFAQSSMARLLNDLTKARAKGFKLAVIDTPPAFTTAIQSVIALADLVVVPTRPSPHDLHAVAATVELIEQNAKPLVFVVNAATRRARITADAAVALSQHGTVAPQTIHQRVDFAVSMIDGQTVGELDPKSLSKSEISALWIYLRDRLRRCPPNAMGQPRTDRALFHAPNRAVFGRRNIALRK
ncbi:MAG: AAA family ATPase [Sphingomonadales bacterium]